MNTILVIGDCHVEPEQDLSRFDLLASIIEDKRPDKIVFMGDFLSLDCLSAWDKDKRKKMEGKRYSEELKAGNEALDRTFKNLRKINENARKSKKAVYKPEVYFLEGNHEDRLTRYFDFDPTFDGHVSIRSDLSLDSRGFIWIPYRDYLYINGIGFTHIPFGKMREISGGDICKKACTVTIKSVVFGHTHEWHVGNNHVQGMDHLQQVLNCGCYFEEKPDYVKGKVTVYWDGVFLLHNYKYGRFDLESYSHGRLKRLYA